MTTRDEEIQRNVESGNFDGMEDLEVRAYQQVFSALKAPADTALSPSFADRVIQAVLERRSRRESSRDMWWFGAGIFLLCVAAFVALVFVGFKVNLGFLKAIADFKWLIALAIALMGTFHLLDRTLIRHHRPMV